MSVQFALFWGIHQYKDLHTRICSCYMCVTYQYAQKRESVVCICKRLMKSSIICIADLHTTLKNKWTMPQYNKHN